MKLSTERFDEKHAISLLDAYSRVLMVTNTVTTCDEKFGEK